MPSPIARALFLSFALWIPIRAAAQTGKENQELAREILKQLIEINTTDSVGSVTAASQAMAERLRAAGFEEKEIQLAGPRDNKKNLVVRYHGAGKRSGRTGPAIPSPSSKKTGFSTAAARRT
jgi:acetylornithine deacetylase/succinyl-diaminopimelate desuccinylase-like protein